jgi:hypothetical protein
VDILPRDGLVLCSALGLTPEPSEPVTPLPDSLHPPTVHGRWLLHTVSPSSCGGTVGGDQVPPRARLRDSRGRLARLHGWRGRRWLVTNFALDCMRNTTPLSLSKLSVKTGRTGRTGRTGATLLDVPYLSTTSPCSTRPRSGLASFTCQVIMRFERGSVVPLPQVLS